MPKPAPDGAPNVLFYVLDDVGYGQLSTFGGLIPTPNLQRIADAGVMYTNFHTTGLCSPTRTCIITGHNHHTNAMGTISEWSTGYPGYNGMMPLKHGFLSEILVEEGYNTYMIGKWHMSVSTYEQASDPTSCGLSEEASSAITGSSPAKRISGTPISPTTTMRTQRRQRRGMAHQ